MSKNKRCKGRTKSGRRCANQPQGGSRYCHLHQDQATTADSNPPDGPQQRYMWRHQRNVQSLLQLESERLFDLISPALNPHTSIVGIERMEGKDTISTEAGIHVVTKGRVCSKKDFTEVPTIWRQLQAHDSEGQTTGGDSTENILENEAFNAHREQVILRNLKQAFKTCIEKHNRSIKSFVSTPKLINNYWVVLILSIDKKEYSKYHILEPRTYQDKSALATSFIEANATEFLEDCHERLNLSDSPTFMPSHYTFSLNDIQNRAAEELLQRAIVECQGFPSYGAGTFYHLNSISNTPYESQESYGKLIITPRHNTEAKAKVQFENEIPLGETRSVRKLLELSGESHSLLSDGEHVYGLGETPKECEDGLFSLQFEGVGNWTLEHGVGMNQILLQSKFGIPGLPKERFDKTYFGDLFEQIFSRLPSNDLVRLIDRLIDESAGALLIITDREEAIQEAGRLRRQSTPINPVKLNITLIKSLTKIDGAVLIDSAYTCYAIGVILDGKATDKGDPARGSRYNSALRYVEDKESDEAPYTRIAVVISEDGYVDILPKPN